MKKLQTYQAKEVDDLEEICLHLIDIIGNYKMITLVGDLGAGKTTFVKALLGQYNVSEPITSPTFSIVNEYRSDKASFYHMDLYRLKSPDELLEIGIEEYIHDDHLCIVEWPELIYEFIEDKWLEIIISVDEGIRTLTIHERSH